MRRTILQVSGLLLVGLTTYLLLLVGWTLWRNGGAAAPLQGSGGESRQVVVGEVLAANRLRLESGEEVRLAAIAVPDPGEPFAEEGKLASRALVGDQSVRLEGPLHDAYVYLPEGQLLQSLLISGGYARVAEGAAQSDLVATLRDEERQARDGNLGLWGGMVSAGFPTPVPTVAPIACEPSLVPGSTIGPEAAAAQMGQLVNVVFLPTRSAERNGSVTLLAGVSEDDFGVVIPAGLASTMPSPQLAFLNHCLVATGRIERAISGTGPRITLRSFDELIVLQ